MQDQYDLKQSNTYYFEKTQNHPVTMEECKNDLINRPEGCPKEKLFFWQVYENEKCIALVSYLEGFPEADIVYLGLLMVDEATHGKGVGRKINQAFMRATLACGYEKVRLCCYLANEHGYWFWRRNRYVAVKTVERDEEGVKRPLLIMECDVTAPHMLEDDVREYITVRSETKEDYYNSEWMTKKAFWNKHHSNLGCDEHYLVKVLRESADYIPEVSRIAVVEGRVVGGIWYSKSKVITKEKEYDILNFGPLCVEPEYQGTGVGGILLEETKKLAKEAGYDGIIIFGEPGYYPKHGFKTCDNYGITTIDGKNYDAFMGIELQPGAFEKMRGGYYTESEVFEQLAKDKVEAYDQNFPHMDKMKLPGQWD